MNKAEYLVAIGASAGGLEPMIKVIKSLKKTSSIAYVILMHLQRDHKSFLTDILSSKTELPVVKITSAMVPQADHIYVLTENTFATIEDGQIQVRDRLESEKINQAVNIFYKSMAETYRDKSIAVILSGSGDDGFAGSQVIKEAGGLLLVQDPETADFKGMPGTIVNKDHPDAVIVPGDLADYLVTYLSASRNNLESSLP
ncbi:chemotaxis protein CheB [Pedobacter sp. GR22-10]|uniref:chemotaxis protein CheB n=1 Tax=Pedobacter sp. GR22-10 TaxID=2994472 RepID=UPI0022486437|nr:chemotaxis protein CheB [Pedobacter sp. GR22-10]MCX2429881.1 chemotaxis protein CheB [Pedobacter sp. GR22-10]